jgi:hypothetical protein
VADAIVGVADSAVATAGIDMAAAAMAIGVALTVSPHSQGRPSRNHDSERNAGERNDAPHLPPGRSEGHSEHSVPLLLIARGVTDYWIF